MCQYLLFCGPAIVFSVDDGAVCQSKLWLFFANTTKIHSACSELLLKGGKAWGRL